MLTHPFSACFFIQDPRLAGAPDKLRRTPPSAPGAEQSSNQSDLGAVPLLLLPQGLFCTCPGVPGGKAVERNRTIGFQDSKEPSGEITAIIGRESCNPLRMLTAISEMIV